MGKDKWAGVSARLSTMSGDAPKSAYELAMERLHARQFYTAKVAEREILHQAALPGVRTHEELDRLNEELRRDRERLATDRDRKIAEIRGKKPS